MSSKPTPTAFTGVRLRHESPKSYPQLLAALHEQIGDTPLDLQRAAIEHPDWDSYQAFIREKTPTCGLMLMWQVDHGKWLQIAGLPRQAMRVVLGNPLVAWTMIREDICAGLFAPVEILVLEEPDNRSSITYVRPSSLMLLTHNPRLADAAYGLDEKLQALVATVAG